MNSFNGNTIKPSGAKRSAQKVEKEPKKSKQVKKETNDKPKKIRGPYKKRNQQANPIKPLPNDEVSEVAVKKETNDKPKKIRGPYKKRIPQENPIILLPNDGVSEVAFKKETNDKPKKIRGPYKKRQPPAEPIILLPNDGVSEVAFKKETNDKTKKIRGPYKKRQPPAEPIKPLPNDEVSEVKAQQIRVEFQVLSQENKEFILNLVKSTSDDPKAAEFQCTSVLSFDDKHMKILKKFMRPCGKNLDQLSLEDQATLKTCLEIRMSIINRYLGVKAHKPRGANAAGAAIKPPRIPNPLEENKKRMPAKAKVELNKPCTILDIREPNLSESSSSSSSSGSSSSNSGSDSE